LPKRPGKESVKLPGMFLELCGGRDGVGERITARKSIGGGVLLMGSCGGHTVLTGRCYEGWNFNSGNYLFTTDKNRYMFRSFTVLQRSHQHCVQPVASDVEVVGYL